jgi:DNA-binding response OmpR family regulator
MKALIIEDDVNVVEAVSLCLQLRWPEVIISTSIEGKTGIEMLQSESFDIVILDINLPDIDGFSVLKSIRSFSNVPILILTVRGAEEDQAKGLETGADDYIVKPFRPRDLVARVNAILRRTSITKDTEEPYSVTRGKLVLKLASNEVRLGDKSVELTPTECKLLYALMTNAEHTISSETIIKEIWGKDYTDSETVRTYIRRLRTKLNDRPPQIIINERGGGYRFVSPT